MTAVFFGPVGAAASSQTIEDAYPQVRTGFDHVHTCTHAGTQAGARVHALYVYVYVYVHVYLHPQLVGPLFVFNLSGGVLRWMWDSTVKPLLPERMRFKTFVIDQESCVDRRLVAEHIAPEHLHTAFGGSSGVWPPPSAAAEGKGRW